jgi:hypothetical protein
MTIQLGKTAERGQKLSASAVNHPSLDVFYASSRGFQTKPLTYSRTLHMFVFHETWSRTVRFFSLCSYDFIHWHPFELYETDYPCQVIFVYSQVCTNPIKYSSLVYRDDTIYTPRTYNRINVFKTRAQPN